MIVGGLWRTKLTHGFRNEHKTVVEIGQSNSDLARIIATKFSAKTQVD